MVTLEEIQTMVDEVVSEYKEIGLRFVGEIGNVSVSKRMTSALGYCIKKANEKTFSLRFAENLLFTNPEFAKRAVAHEVLHTCVYCQNHGFDFKKMQVLLNKN